MTVKPRKILVTSALPYANGSIHMGHMIEYIQTDIWVRFQKLRGHECTYAVAGMPADDRVGTKSRAKATTATKAGLRIIVFPFDALPSRRFMLATRELAPLAP